MIDCRLPQREPAISLVIASMVRAPMTEAEASTAAIVRTGMRDSEIAMIGRPPELLGRLQCSYRTLSEGNATPEQRDAAAQHLILCTHKPWRVLAAQYMARRKGLTIGGVQ